jgi:dTDP-4-dehydrorhamnose reductase
MAANKKLLVTGASGFLGYHLLQQAVPGWDVYGICHTHTFEYAGAQLIKCDITNYIELGNYFDDIEPDAVIHAAAVADANFCQLNPQISYAINVEAARNIAGICTDFQVPFAFTSTDLVFDGKKGMYHEDDARNPLSIYGEHKAQAEDEILDIYPGATIFRLPFMFGNPMASAGNFTRKFIDQLKENKSFNLFSDEYRSAASAYSVSRGILQLFEQAPGIIHLAGAERLSRYDIGVKMVRAFNLPENLLHACLQKDAPSVAPRPADVSLSISKAVSLGYVPGTADEGLAYIAGKLFKQI